MRDICCHLIIASTGLLSVRQMTPLIELPGASTLTHLPRAILGGLSPLSNGWAGDTSRFAATMPQAVANTGILRSPDRWSAVLSHRISRTSEHTTKNGQKRIDAQHMQLVLSSAVSGEARSFPVWCGTGRPGTHLSGSRR